MVALNDLFVRAPLHGRGGRRIDAAVMYARGVGALRHELATRHTTAAALRMQNAGGFVDAEFAHLALTVRSDGSVRGDRDRSRGRGNVRAR